jgi:hypothetical protein
VAIGSERMAVAEPIACQAFTSYQENRGQHG